MCNTRSQYIVVVRVEPHAVSGIVADLCYLLKRGGRHRRFASHPNDGLAHWVAAVAVPCEVTCRGRGGTGSMRRLRLSCHISHGGEY
jgi:hypothetical protein